MSDSIFKESFDSYVITGETISATVDGFTLTATIHDDDNSGRKPWHDCGHGPVTGWLSRAKAPGELILASDGGSHRFYDYAAAVAIARRDSWGARPVIDGEAPGAKAARAAMADYEALRAWCNDEWRYVGVSVSVSKDEVELTGDYDHALWGIEANYSGGDENAYLSSVANEYAGEALAAARAKLASLCECHA